MAPPWVGAGSMAAQHRERRQPARTRCPSWNKMVKRGFDQAQLQVCYDKQKELGNGGRWAPDWKEENWVELGQDCGIGKHLLATPLMWCCCRPTQHGLNRLW